MLISVDGGMDMLDGILFDLDGTLWKTEKSYIYAYQKLMEEFHLDPLPQEVIYSVVGKPLSYVQGVIFNRYSNVEELTKKAVAYSIEYVQKNPSFCSNQIENLFSQLHKRVKIYIISGCPRCYLDAFLSLSNTASYITASYSLEDGNKKSILNRFNNQRLLFVGDSNEEYDAIENHKNIFFCYAKYGFIQLDTYDYYIQSLDDIISVLDKIEVKERILRNDSYEIISYKDTNLAYIEKQNGRNYFGFLNIDNLEDFRIVLRKLKEKGSVYGPFDGNTWFSYRIPLDSFDFHLYPDCAGNEDLLKVFLEEGFVVKTTYSSTLAPIHKAVWDRCKKRSNEKYKVQIFEAEACYQHLEELYQIASIAFSEADFYEPIIFEDFKDIYLKNIRLVQPDILMIYDGNHPVAFNFCYEDIEKRFYVCKTIAILPEYQNKTVLKLLIDASYQLMEKRGYQEVLYHFQNERTRVLNGIFKNGILRQKKYGVLAYENK